MDLCVKEYICNGLTFLVKKGTFNSLQSRNKIKKYPLNLEK